MRLYIILCVMSIYSCIPIWSDLLYLDELPYAQADLPLLPNSNYLLTSYDFKYGQPLISTALRTIIFDYYTYTNGWSVIIDTVKYAMPDQLYVLSDPYEDKECINQIFYTASDVLDELFQSFTIGFNCKHINGTFSLSEQYTDFNEQYNMHSSYTSNSYITVLCSRMEFNRNIRLNKIFKNILYDLPNNYTSETCDVYKKFISTYGTSFLVKARYGGYTNMVSNFTIDSTYGKSSDTINLELSTKFMMMNSNNKISWNDTEIYQNLDSTYTSQMKIIGGDPSLTDDEWIASVPNNPLIVEGDIMSLSELLPPNSDQKNALSEALDAYYNSKLCVF